MPKTKESTTGEERKDEVKATEPTAAAATPAPKAEMLSKDSTAGGGSGDGRTTAAANQLAAPRLDTSSEPAAPALESLALLADRYRVPTWQQAALARMMGWEEGKMVSNADYLDALNKLKTRRLGGGRMR